MHRLRILFLIISGSFALLSSCATQTVKGFAEVEPVAKNYHATYFSDPATDYVYKANISVYGREFGGIFIAKRINDTVHRVAFTTEFGNKLFDFEISDTEFKVNYIIEAMDKGIVVNTLKRDFMLLLKKNYLIDSQFQDAGYNVYKSKDGKRYNYLFIDRPSGKLVKVVNATKSKEKIIISYVPESDILANNIVIDHKNIKLRIELNYMKEMPAGE